MNQWTRVVLVLSTLPLLGCPYDSPTPVADASTRPLDTRLAGDWRCVGPKDKEAVVLRFAAISPVELEVDQVGADKPNPFRLHSGTLDGAPVLNLEDRNPDDKNKWALGRYTFLRPNVVHFELAREEPFKAAPAGTKPAETASKALARSDLFADYCVCIRAEEEKR
ncbi:MAG: hypothetical protein DMF78_01465 [Acidobacteria bacterium]|nr:MAG: hypothetical protein DMF78_01465 [Acidobacteriota bacterium]